MPHFEQKKCFAVPVLNWYTLNASSPCSMVMPSSSADTATAPRMRQYEQLQRRAVRRPSVSLTVKRTVPQWHEALDSVMSGSIDAPSGRDRDILKAASLMWEPLQRRYPAPCGSRFSGDTQLDVGAASAAMALPHNRKTPGRHRRQILRPLGIATKRPPDPIGPLDADAGITPFGRSPVHRRAEGLETGLEAADGLAGDPDEIG